MSQVKSELQLLKERADMLGIPYSNNIGIDTLREKVNEKLSDDSTEKSSNPRRNKREEERKKQMKLVRVIISNMNPANGDLQGGIYSASNALVGLVEKYIPYQTDDRGYHIPRILLNALKRRRFRQTNTVKDPITKEDVTITRHLKEFNIIELPDLTQAELDKVKKDNMALAELHN